MLSNSIVEILEFFNIEITYIAAAIYLNQSENSAVVLTVSMTNIMNCFFISMKKLPYSAFCEFLGKKNAKLAKFVFLHSFVLSFFVSFGFLVIFCIIFNKIAKNTFSDDILAKKYASDAVWKTIYLSYSRIFLSFIFDILKGLDMRIMACFWAGLTCVFTFIFEVFISGYFVNKVVGSLLGYCLPMMVVSFLSLGQLWRIDWKKRIDNLENMRD